MSIIELVTETAQLFKKNHWKLAVAESCTGGGLAYQLTSIPGSSEWFDRGFVTYSNSAKQDMLGVSLSTLEKFGAVSQETAQEMAEGALRHSQANIAIAITGVAGPGGGTAEKPVGTVCIAWSSANAQTVAQLYHLTGDRKAIRQQSIQLALQGLLIR
ncbi:MAG TPA: CinA family protein [Gammaproteobacteria bacterium]|nr:CinA family protein [Gammaproteobacteria bacterium]